MDETTKDLMFLELLSVEILMLISHFSLEASISVFSQRLFYTASYLSFGACFLSIIQRWQVVRNLELG